MECGEFKANKVVNISGVFLTTQDKLPMCVNLDLYLGNSSKSQRHIVFLLRSVNYQFAGNYLLSEELGIEKGENDAFEYFEELETVLKQNASELYILS